MSWLLATIVLVNAYAGAKASMMTLPHYEPILNTLEEVVASDRFKIISQKGSTMTNQFLVSLVELNKTYFLAELPYTLRILISKYRTKGSNKRDL